MIDFSRVQKELQECSRDIESSGIRVDPKSDNLAPLTGTIPGPIGTPYEGGSFQIDISFPDQWSPALTLKTALLSLQALLSAPQSDDPQDAIIAQQYLRDYQTFVGTACYWTETFAKTSRLRSEDKVQKLTEMGFPESFVRSTLEAVGDDENLALEKLFLAKEAPMVHVISRYKEPSCV